MKKRFLVVDDTIYNHMFEEMVIKSLMDELHIDIVNDKAYTISEALNMIENNENYDVVLSDINLPDGRGSTVASAAKYKNGNTKTAAFTIYPSIIYEKEKAYFDLLLCKLKTLNAHRTSLLRLLLR